LKVNNFGKNKSFASFGASDEPKKDYSTSLQQTQLKNIADAAQDSFFSQSFAKQSKGLGGGESLTTTPL